MSSCQYRTVENWDGVKVGVVVGVLVGVKETLTGSGDLDFEGVGVGFSTDFVGSGAIGGFCLIWLMKW